MKKILFRYIFLELVAPTILGLMTFSFILLSTRILRSANRMAETQIPLTLVIETLLALLPHLLILTVPMACLVGVLMAYGRLSEQNEIQAMQAGGVRYLSILMPAFVFGFGIAALLFVWTNSMIPKSYKLQELMAGKLLQSMTTVGIEEGVFIDDFPNLVLYTKSYDLEDSSLRGTLVFKLQPRKKVNINDPHSQYISMMIISPTGTSHFQPDTKELLIDLHGGSIYLFGQESGIALLNYDRLSIRVNVKNLVRRFVGRGLKDYYKMSLGDLGRKLDRLKAKAAHPTKEQTEFAIEYHRRMALPLACGLISLVACPLGILMGREKRALLFLLSLGLITAYYLVLSGGTKMADEGYFPAYIGVWLANVVLLLLSILLNLWASRQK
jgi:lipopolysaccharide export system permease protein